MDKIEESKIKCCSNVEKTIDENVKCMIEGIRAKSEIVAKLEEEGKLKIVGMKYFFEDGSVKPIE